MATIRELRARFTADTRALTTGFRDASRQAADLGTSAERAAQQAERSYSGLIASTGQLRNALGEVGGDESFDELRAAIERTEREVEQFGTASESAMQDLGRAIDNSGSHFSGLSDDARLSLDRVRSAVNDVDQDIRTLGSRNSLGDLRQDATQAENSIDDVTNAFEEMGDAGETSAESAGQGLGGLSKAAVGVAGGFAAVVGSLGLMIKGGDDLQRTLNGMEASTGATKEEMAGMESSLKNIYKNNYGESFDDIAESMTSVKQMTGLAGTELEDMTKNGLMLRDTFGYEVAESVKGASSLMKNFGVEGEEAYALIAEGSQKGLNYADDLMDTIGEYSVYYENAGFSAQDMLGQFENAKKAGVFNLDYAADAFKEFGIIMTEDSDRAKDALSSLGLPSEKLIEDFAKGGESAKAAFATIAEKVGSVKDPLDRTQVGIELFGTKFEDLGADAVIAMTKTNTSIKGTKDVLESIDAVKYNSVGEAITGIGRKFVVGVLMPLQNKIMPGVNGAITGMTTHIGNAFEALTGLISGGWSGGDIIDAYSLDPKKWQGAINLIDGVKAAFGRLQTSAKNVGVVVKAAWALFKNQDGTAINLLAGLGMKPEQIQRVMDAVDRIKTSIAALWQGLKTAFAVGAPLVMSFWSKLTKFLVAAFEILWPKLQPIIQNILKFVGDTFKKIVAFWQSDGQQLMQAVGKAFNFILSIIKFIMPAVLGIIKMIWGNIKGVITGALDIIMGVVKIFSGIFTGDFKKMWEGVKQLFSGAVRFIWNLVQLTFYGGILRGAKVFFAAFRGGFAAMWAAVRGVFTTGVGGAWTAIKAGWAKISTETVKVFKSIWGFLSGTFTAIKNIFTIAIKGYFNLVRGGWTLIFSTTSRIFGNVFRYLQGIFVKIRDSISGSVSTIFRKVRDTWTALKTNTSGAFRDIFNGIKNKFTDIVNLAKGLPKRIGDGIGSMAAKVTAGVTKVINALARTLGKGVNGVIGGVNWVLGKIGVDKEVPLWDVPQYAQGTKGHHPGGPMIVGDGKGGNKGPEMIEYPDGTQMLSPAKPTLMGGPKGTKVWSATDTREMLAMIPHYAWGTEKLKAAGNWVKDKYNSGKKKVKSVAKTVKDAAFNAFDYIKKPGKFLDLALKTLGIEKPKGGNFAGNIAGGGWNQVKAAAIDFIKSKLSTFGAAQSGIAVTGGDGGGFGPPFRFTSGPGPRNTGIPGASTMHKGWDWAAPIGTNIPSVTDGIGHRTGFHPLSGNFVEVKDGSGLIHRYQHNSKNIVRVGQKVKKGQTIALVGDTGVGSGAHVHYEKRKGYAKGGMITSEHTATVGEGGKKEVIIPLEQHRNRAVSLWNQAGSELGISNGTTAILYNEQQEVVQEIRNVVASLVAQTAQMVRQNPILLGIKSAIGLVVPAIKKQVASSAAVTNAKLASGIANVNAKVASGIAGTKAAVSSTKAVIVSTKAAVLKSVSVGNKQTRTEGANVRARISETAGKIREVVVSMGNSVLKVARSALQKAAAATAVANQAISRAASAASAAKAAAVRRSAPARQAAPARKPTAKAAPTKKRVVSQHEKNYFQFIREDGDWLNDEGMNVPIARRRSLFIEGYYYAKSLGKDLGKYADMHLKRIRGYENGGIVSGKMGAQLAWLTEGGWSESVISHDPAKKSSQRAIWQETGRELGFDTDNAEVLSMLQRIAEGVESGHMLVLNERQIGKALKPRLDTMANTQAKIDKVYNKN